MTNPVVGQPERYAPPVSTAAGNAFGAPIAAGTRYARLPAVAGTPQQGPYPFMPPGEPLEVQASIEMTLEQLRDVVQQTWDSHLKYALGFDALPGRQQYEFYRQHEPLYMFDTATQQMVDGPWIGRLRAISAVETSKHEQRYKELQKQFAEQMT